MKYLSLAAVLACATPTMAADDWTVVDLPDYAANVEFIAIGSDGFLYSVETNANGIVLSSLTKSYSFQPRDQWTVDILARNNVYYLGTGCDASVGDDKGVWTKDSTGLNVAFMPSPNAQPSITWRFLDTDLTSGNDC